MAALADKYPVDIRGIVGTAPVDWSGVVQAARAVAAQSAKIPPDRVEALLIEMATPTFSQLLSKVDDKRIAPLNPAAVQAILSDTKSLIARGDTVPALAKITDWIRTNPQAAELVRDNPDLEPIRGELTAVLRHLVTESAAHAAQAMDRAAIIIDAAGPQPAFIEGADPRAILAVAARFADAGRIVDNVRARELADIVIERCRPGVPATLAVREWVTSQARRARQLWHRAPLLVLLVGWLLAGLTGLIGTNAWPLGLLALVSLAFYSRIRRIRF